MPLLLIGLVLLVLVVGLLVSMPAGQSLTLLLPLFGKVQSPATALVWLLCGVVAIAVICIAGDLFRYTRSGPRAPGALWERLSLSLPPPHFLASPLREIFIATLLLVLALIAVLLQQIALPRAILLVVFATASITTFVRAMELLANEPLEIQGHWGGLGGGLGGWRLSRSVVMLLLALVAAGATIAAATVTRPGEASRPAPPGSAVEITVRTNTQQAGEADKKTELHIPPAPGAAAGSHD